MAALKVCACLLLLVAVSQAAILDPMTVMKDDISRIKVMMEHLGETMERFNGLYLSKLETRLLTSATSLAHIDSNVKNLQERAHVWDTFQLHVAAWNEQIKSLDKKLDILNRGTEKWDMIDEKVASLQPLDYKLNKVMTKLEEMETKVGEIHRKVNAGAGQQAGSASAVVHTQPVSVALPSVETPLFSEYTGRGVLSALKDIEVKVNKLADGHSRPFNGNGAAGSSPSSRELQQQTLDVVNDVAGKVDIILDKVLVKSRPEGPADDVSYDDGDTDYGNGSSIGEGSVHQTERSLIKLWRRMLQPVRRANRKFETLDRVLNQLERAANASAVQRRDDTQLLDDMSSMLECCSRNEVEMRSLSQKVELLATSVRDGQETIDQRMAAAVRAGQDSADQRCSAAVRAGQEAADQRCLASLRAGLEAVDTRCTAAVRAGQDAAEQRSASEVEQAQARLQQTQSALVSQIGDLVKEHVGELVKEHVAAGVERIRQSLNQRKKPNAAGGQGSNETLLVVEDDVVTDGGKTAAASASNATATLASGKIGLRGCHDLRLAGETESRVYSLASGKELNEGGRDYNARFCDMTTDGGGWTVIQRRGDYGAPRENFSVGWREYKLGFGQLEREFWFGNDFIHRLTNEHDVVLRVELWDFDDGHVFADYESFRVDSEEDLYRLWVEGYQGNATDSLGSHNGYAFSTFDRDNDEAPPCCPCAPAYGGGWWFYSCFEANLNGEYHTNPTDNDYYRGIIWELWRGDYSLRRAEMKIRPHDFPRLMAVASASTTTTTSTTLPPPPPPDATADDYAAIPEDP